MKRSYKVFRGGIPLGYVGFDNLSPCEQFEPLDGYEELKPLFDREHELTLLAAEADERGDVSRFDTLLGEANKVMDEIVEPGIRFEAQQEVLSSFSCDELAIFDGRVCWR